MPTSRRVSWAQLKVGILAGASLLLLGILIFLLTGNKDIFARDASLYTYMEDSAAMTEGSAVRLNGILIGSVEKITLTGEREPGRAVRFELRVKERELRHIPVDSLVTIGAENVLGTKYLNIRQGTSPETVRAGATLRARDDQDFLEIVQSAQPILESMRQTLARIDAIVATVEAGRGSIGKLLVDETLYNRLVGILGDAQKITGAITSGTGTAGKFFYDDALYNDIRKAVADLDAIALDLRDGQGTAGKFLKDPTLYNELNKTTAELRQLLANLNSGKGTAGKLIASDELYTQLGAVLGRVDKTITVLNSGQGTLGQLLVNPSLYDSVNATSQELTSLLKDFRANPKKFLRIRVSLF